jgi:hypothetical protein
MNDDKNCCDEEILTMSGAQGNPLRGRLLFTLTSNRSLGNAAAGVGGSTDYTSTIMPRLIAIATTWVRPLAPNFDEMLFI